MQYWLGGTSHHFECELTASENSTSSCEGARTKVINVNSHNRASMPLLALLKSFLLQTLFPIGDFLTQVGSSCPNVANDDEIGALALSPERRSLVSDCIRLLQAI